MPYIIKKERPQFNEISKQLTDILLEKYEHDFEGRINYFIFKTLLTLFRHNKRYFTANKLDGILGCVQKEFYRRHIGPYEDECIEKNGDVE